MKRYTVKIDGKVSSYLSIHDDQDPKIQYAKKLGFADFAAWVAHMDATGWPEIEFIEIEPSNQTKGNHKSQCTEKTHPTRT